MQAAGYPASWAEIMRSGRFLAGPDKEWTLHPEGGSVRREPDRIELFLLGATRWVLRLGAMQLGKISRDDVLKAIAEHDDCGADAFRDRYGFGAARRYVLVHEGKGYDSKAIAAVAHRYGQGRALRSHEFSGGLVQTVRWLRRLGFEVVDKRGASAAP